MTRAGSKESAAYPKRGPTNRSRRLATLAFFEDSLLARLYNNVAGFASPQAAKLMAVGRLKKA
jgi:hypothetical protein